MDHHLGPAVHILAVGIAGGRHQYGRNPHPQQHGPDRLGALVGERPPLGLRAGAVGMTDDRDRRLAVSIDHFGNRLKRRDSYTSAISPSHQRTSRPSVRKSAISKTAYSNRYKSEICDVADRTRDQNKDPAIENRLQGPPKLNITWEGNIETSGDLLWKNGRRLPLCWGWSKVPFRPRQRLVNSI